MPVVPNHARTFQWARELRRSNVNTIAVSFIILDAEPIFIGRYNEEKIQVTAAEAHQFFQEDHDYFGYETIVPRSIRAGEIRNIGPAPRITGWRFFPGAKGQRPYWPIAGSKNAAKLRQAIIDWHDSYEV